MDSSNLTRDQRQQLCDQIGRQLRYLNNLCGRMQQQRWPVEDHVSREAMRARESLQDLYAAIVALPPHREVDGKP